MTVRTPILAKPQSATMFGGVIPSGQQPLRIDGKLADDFRDYIDEECHVDASISVIEEDPEPLWFYRQTRGKLTE